VTYLRNLLAGPLHLSRQPSRLRHSAAVNGRFAAATAHRRRLGLAVAAAWDARAARVCCDTSSERRPQRVDQLDARLNTSGRRPIRPATIAIALEELHAAGLSAVVDVHDQDVTAGRWSAVTATRDPLLGAVDLHGAHDLRHTFATWLEDAGIPARVIDELMGHEATGRTGQHQASAMGAHYRHTTPEMAGRVIDAVQQRLTIVLQVAEQALEYSPNRSGIDVF